MFGVVTKNLSVILIKLYFLLCFNLVEPRFHHPKLISDLLGFHVCEFEVISDIENAVERKTILRHHYYLLNWGRTALFIKVILLSLLDLLLLFELVGIDNRVQTLQHRFLGEGIIVG